MNKQQMNGVPSALGAAERSGAVPKAGPTSPPNPELRPRGRRLEGFCEGGEA